MDAQTVRREETRTFTRMRMPLPEKEDRKEGSLIQDV